MISKTYDLEERTFKFSEKVIALIRSLPQNSISQPIINQLIRSATSIGANYMEANGASSPKDFQNKIFICKKECHETKYWLRLLKTCYPASVDEVDKLLNESQELTLIFQKILTTMRGKSLKIDH